MKCLLSQCRGTECFGNQGIGTRQCKRAVFGSAKKEYPCGANADPFAFLIQSCKK